MSGLARAQVARGHRVRVVTLVDPGLEPTIAGVEVVALPRIGPRRYPLARGLVGAVRGADLVHVHGLDGLLDLLVAQRRAVGAPIGVSTHGGYFHTPRHRWVKAAWLRTGTRWSLGRADAVWFTSEADRDLLRPATVRGAVLENGVDVERFAGVVRRPEPGRWLVLGRIDVHKGIEALVDALPHADRTVRIDLVGPESAPGLMAALCSRATALGVSDRIRFLGALTGGDLLEALGRADRLVLPSRHEGFGLAAVEGMAAGVPVVLSDIPAFRRHRGVARIVSFADPAAAARAVGAPMEAGWATRAAAHAATFGWAVRSAAFERAYAPLVAQ